MSETVCLPQDEPQLVLFEVDRRNVTVAFDGGEVVTDTPNVQTHLTCV